MADHESMARGALAAACGFQYKADRHSPPDLESAAWSLCAELARIRWLLAKAEILRAESEANQQIEHRRQHEFRQMEAEIERLRVLNEGWSQGAAITGATARLIGEIAKSDFTAEQAADMIVVLRHHGIGDGFELEDRLQRARRHDGASIVEEPGWDPIDKGA